MLDSFGKRIKVFQWIHKKQLAKRTLGVCMETQYDKIIQKGINQNKNIASKHLRNKEKAVLNRLLK